MLTPKKGWVQYTYDALGRRVTKTHRGETTHYIWDGNVLFHEWTAKEDESHTKLNEAGQLEVVIPENLTTWIFEEGSFVPQAKLINGKSYSIITDHLGTPIQAYDEEGEKVWSCELDIYGKVRKFAGDKTFMPFRFQGQFEDEETDLYYNRFRYYCPGMGTYIRQDPLSIDGGMPNVYAYVHDVSIWVDPLGLARAGHTSFIGDALHPDTITASNPGGIYNVKATGSYQGDKAALYGKAGLKEGFSPEYIGHHVKYNPNTNEMTMQVVKRDAHSKVPHVGGVKDYEAATGKKYKSSTKTSCTSQQ